MGWSIGWNGYRDIGYSVPAVCDKPDCDEEIDRGLSFVCGDFGSTPEYGCGLYFCDSHLQYRKPHGADADKQLCPRCYAYKTPYKPKPDVEEWINWKLTDASWEVWRKEHPEEVKSMSHVKPLKRKSRESREKK